ncbi:hypothetical protein HanHA300_Chr09g0312901 [Helianthus annuus]|nr:hypothetical protein HanHA300_Chr09g0312901 [Helianthus annuus]KAJ0541896.1 hypothetical protein HanHA89_Chr09g0333801 [Helianthus annuus]KAJ0710996.1 hypothetical protein HanOQP8_Chr09g0318881 [Helianthus annuus]
MHASKSRLGNDITKSYIASLAHEYSGCISKTRHVWNRRTMKGRVLSGVQFLEVLAYILLLLCNEDTSPVTPTLIFSGCDIVHHLKWYNLIETLQTRGSHSWIIHEHSSSQANSNS